MPKAIDLTNRQFGSLKVLNVIPGSRSQKRAWYCLCKCGATTKVPTNELQSGHIKSCGCKQLDGIAATRVIHGYAKRGAKTPEYNIWCTMIARCHNPNSNQYSRYGAQGIKVCDRWRTSFQNFIDDMGTRPSNKHSIDRYPNNKGNYEPDNSRWATQKEQMNNTYRTIRLSYEGQTKTLSEWANFWQMGYNDLYGMLLRRGKLNKLFVVR